jgi:hypothetical protein
MANRCHFPAVGNKKAALLRHRATHRNHPNHQIITFLADGRWQIADAELA